MTPVGETLNGAPNLADISTAQSIQAQHDHNTLINARMAIRERIAMLESWYQNYLAYLKDRVAGEDLHGIWDSGANMSEVKCEIDGLRFALEALGG